MRTIDIHTHGIGGYETKGASPEDILKIAELHGVHGVDAILPTIYAAPIEAMRRDIAAVGKAMEKQRSAPNIQSSKSATKPTSNIEHRTVNRTGNHRFPALILGVHLEGPFLNPAFAGALDGASFLPAEIPFLEGLLEGFGDIVKIITVAPELSGAEKLIRSIRDRDIVVSMGHSGATYNEAEAGFNAGATGITHLFNAMADIHHREPGIAGFALTNPHIFVEIIADPFHLHPRTIELVFAAKSPDKIILVSDSVKGTNADAAAEKIVDDSGRLQGGSMTIMESARYLLGLGMAQEAVERSISSNPDNYLSGLAF